MEHYGFLSLLIPLLIIALAIITKDVVVSLLVGILAAQLILHDFNFLASIIDMLDKFVGLFSEGWITKTILFALLVGSIIRLLNDSGAVGGFISYLDKKQKGIDSPKGSLLLAYILGVVIFIESSITALVAGSVARPLCDKNGVSREKLAFVCDSTSAPICSLIPFNAWGALLLGLIITAIESQVISGNGLSLLITSILFNFYSLITVILVLLVILFNIDIGAMKDAKPHKIEKSLVMKSDKSSWLMIAPIIVMILMVPLSLYYTGKGNILQGSGSTSVFYSVLTTLAFIYIYYLATKTISHKKYFESLYAGIADMIPIVLILLLAFLIGNVIKELGTAKYLASILSGNISPVLLPMLIFVVSSVMAFSTGTSWGTFSIMMPIGLALGAEFSLYLPLVIGAVVSGGIFGDHVSPISDTTIISSMASGCDHIAHVKTQMPYALIAAFLAVILFLIVGWIMV
ncbi:MAG: sodium:proton antiporter [Campylobacterales bacterium]|nr:sodium:proton antiporter [Campylobacterales bacterium]